MVLAKDIVFVFELYIVHRRDSASCFSKRKRKVYILGQEIKLTQFKL